MFERLESSVHWLARRAVSVVISVTLNAVLPAATLVLFHSSATEDWFARTKINLAALWHCTGDLGTPGLRPCVEHAASAVQWREAGVKVAAQAESRR